MERTMSQCIATLNGMTRFEMARDAEKVLKNADPTVEGVLKLQEYRKMLNDFINRTLNETMVKALRVYADGRNWDGDKCMVGREVAEGALREVFKECYSKVDIGDGRPVSVQMCPNCGVYPSNVDDCGNFGDYHCPYFGVGER